MDSPIEHHARRHVARIEQYCGAIFRRGWRQQEEVRPYLDAHVAR